MVAKPASAVNRIAARAETRPHAAFRLELQGGHRLCYFSASVRVTRYGWIAKGAQVRLFKALTLCILVGAAAVLASAADAPSITGSWQVHVVIGSYDNVIVCNFTEKADALTGTCGTDNGPAEITGSVNDGKVTWSYKTVYQGSPVTPDYQGTIDSSSTPTKLTGTVDVPELGADGDFTATPSQQ
jgi:hypothetical protein